MYSFVTYRYIVTLTCHQFTPIFYRSSTHLFPCIHSREYVHVATCVSVCLCERDTERDREKELQRRINFERLPQLFFTLLFETRFLWTWSSLTWIIWCAIKPPPSASLLLGLWACPSVSGFLRGCWGPEFRSSCSHSKHFAWHLLPISVSMMQLSQSVFLLSTFWINCYTIDKT